jgi:hypothetical protein
MEPFHVLPARRRAAACAARARHPVAGGWMCATVGPDVGPLARAAQWLDQIRRQLARLPAAAPRARPRPPPGLLEPVSAPGPPAGGCC